MKLDKMVDKMISAWTLVFIWRMAKCKNCCCIGQFMHMTGMNVMLTILYGCARNSNNLNPGFSLFLGFIILIKCQCFMPNPLGYLSARFPLISSSRNSDSQDNIFLVELGNVFASVKLLLLFVLALRFPVLHIIDSGSWDKNWLKSSQ